MEWTYGADRDADSAVRALVAQTYGVDPLRVELPRRRGAPEARIDGHRVELSRSRSNGYLAAACAGPGEECSLGIDIEVVRPFLDSVTEPAEFAELVLAPEELKWFRETKGAARARRLAWLLRTWVRKEAVLKSLHTGFDTGRGGLPPGAVVLNEPWDAPVCLSHDHITVTDLRTPPGPEGKIATEGPTGENTRDSGLLMLALARNPGPVTRPGR
ncbi:4'-phosphopantetheinyl transferase superfamily protein [Nesterenkonia sp. E16_7]|uniref:4'-phosphopantetheinyl transferase superfamily protein n=1 Tax=unclassified Nesterenkonia TaxID=2629769 RepID=UPI001A92BD8C|nr:4'-phosphopantetheinyl transferase superfamily protein [Nesterenkonia sp. E16_10]MBO0599172.1 4'-phosphopantetheinyl transferase superfamily protein [Nesterenkonia sp. E16_7]